MRCFLRALLLAIVLFPLGILAQATILLHGTASASLPPFMFADPRDYGATCGASTFNVNDATHDDAPGFNAALMTGLPVVIPGSNATGAPGGCKWVTQVTCPSARCVIFSFGGAGPYDALVGIHPAITNPYIFVPDAATTHATNNCVFDSAGFDGVTWNNVTIIGNSMFNGTSAACNSVGIADSRPQAFMNFNNVSISNMAGIGGATDSSCQPTGSLDSPVMQMRINGLYMGHTCFGIYANYSDVEANNIYMANIWNSCIASPTAAGIALAVNNLRCEFTGHFDANPIYRDGEAIYISEEGFAQLSNISFDHIMGSCVTFDGNNGGAQAAGWSSMIGVRCKDAVAGGAVSEGGVINNPANFVFENQAGYITALGISAQNFTNLAKYNLDFVGTQSFAITWSQTASDGPNGGGGWRTAFLNGTIPSGAAASGLILDAPGMHINNTYLTSCSGLPTGSVASLSNVISNCP